MLFCAKNPGERKLNFPKKSFFKIFFLMVASNFKYRIGFPSPLICQSLLLNLKYRLLISQSFFLILVNCPVF